jgi:hypothetical protein
MSASLARHRAGFFVPGGTTTKNTAIVGRSSRNKLKKPCYVAVAGFEGFNP